MKILSEMCVTISVLILVVAELASVAQATGNSSSILSKMLENSNVLKQNTVLINSASALLATPSPINGQVCGYLANVDYISFTAGFNIGSTSNIGTTDQCCSLCSSYSISNGGTTIRCQTWTLDTASNTCYFKSGTGRSNYFNLRKKHKYYT
jgi:hypothetical protein